MYKWFPTPKCNTPKRGRIYSPCSLKTLGLWPRLRDCMAPHVRHAFLGVAANSGQGENPLHHSSVVLQQPASSPPPEEHQTTPCLRANAEPWVPPCWTLPLSGIPWQHSMGTAHRTFQWRAYSSWTHSYFHIIKFYKQSHQAKVTTSTADSCYRVMAGTLQLPAVSHWYKDWPSPRAQPESFPLQSDLVAVWDAEGLNILPFPLRTSGSSPSGSSFLHIF